MAPTISAPGSETFFGIRPATELKRKSEGESSITEKPKEAVNQEMLLFAKRTEGSRKIATASTTVKPVAEHVSAGAISSTPVFEIAKSGNEKHLATAALFNPDGTLTSGALAKAEKNSHSNDKKDGQHTFSVEGKTLADLRAEAMEQDNILGSIMGNYC